jgi:hypothetical protein
MRADTPATKARAGISFGVIPPPPNLTFCQAASAAHNGHLACALERSYGGPVITRLAFWVAVCLGISACAADGGSAGKGLLDSGDEASDGGSTCENPCAPGSAPRCERGVAQTCETLGACSTWRDQGPCSPDSCSDACAQAGTTRCSDGRVERCHADGAGCLSWQEQPGCTTGTCADDWSCTGCVNLCAHAGETRCSGGGVLSCEADAAGCLNWGTSQACASGACADAESCGSCTHTCAALGNTRCVNGKLQTCVADGLGCRAWNAGTDCADSFCADAISCGSCSHSCPATGDTQCALGTLITCVADAHGCRAWNAGTACGDGSCKDATSCLQCDHGCASAGGTACGAGVLSTCVADAQGCRDWNDGTDCADGFCKDTKSCGVCNNVCVEGTKKCDWDGLRTCLVDANGCLGWGAPATCPAGACADPVECYDCTRRFYVDADSTATDPKGLSWASAYKNLDKAMSAARDHPTVCGVPEVWVAEGRYVPPTYVSGNPSFFEIGKPVEIYGGFAGTEIERSQRDPEQHRTIVSGDVLGDDTATGNRADNAPRLFWFGGSGGRTIVSGLIFYGANPYRNDVVEASADDLLLDRVIFASNLATDPWAVGVLDLSVDRLEVRDSVFVTNHGIQIRTWYAPTKVDGVVVVDALNSGESIRLDVPGSVRNTIVVGARGDNSSQRTALSLYGDTTSVENVLIAGNPGEAISSSKSLHMVNSTLFGNERNSYFGAAITAFNSVLPSGTLTSDSATNYTGNAWSAFAASVTGSWASASVYDLTTFQTIFTMADKTFGKDTLKGRLLAPRSGQLPWALIASNEGAVVRVWGNHAGIAANTAFAIHDLRPNPAGPLADQATDSRAPCADLAGAGRVDLAAVGTVGTKADIGAYEAAGAPTAQCGCDECASDQSECASGYSRQCDAGSDGCLTWSTWSKCGTSACLDSKVCAPTCSDACGPLDTTQCSAGQIRTCTMGSQGCRVWSSYAACASGSCASATTCNLACTSNCSANGQTQCQSGQLRTCSLGSNGCLSWGSFAPCASTTCSNTTTCAPVQQVTGVCDRKSNAFQCFEYTGSAWTTATAQGNCTVDGTWASSCPAGTLAGKCLNQGGSASPQAVTVWFYTGSPFSAAQLQQACSDGAGTWQ